MSGPKSTSYRVDRQRLEQERRERERIERERREKLRLEKTCRDLIDQIASMNEKLVKKLQVAMQPESDDLESLRAWKNNLEKTNQKARQLLEAQREQRIMQHIRDSAGRLDLSHIDGSTRNVVKSVDVNAVKAETETIARTLAKIDDETLRDALLNEVHKTLSLEDADAVNAHLLKVKTHAHEALRTQSVRKMALHEIEAIADLESDEADALRALAYTAVSDDDVRRLRSEIAKLADEEPETDVETLYVREAIEEVLIDMGYRIEGDFEVTQFGQVGITEPDEEGYALRVQINPSAKKIYTRLVAVQETSPEQDKKAEEASCPKIHALINQLRIKGINTKLETEQKPGQAAMQKIEPQLLARRHQQRKRLAVKNKARRSI